MRTSRDDDYLDLWAAMAGIGLVGIIAVLMIVGMTHLADVFGPRIGDVVRFDPARTLPSDMTTRLTVTRTGDPTMGPCVLDVRTMMASGGSLVIEAAQPKPDPHYLVHWAGGGTTRDPATDCGTSAAFVLTPGDLVALHLAAGN